MVSLPNIFILRSLFIFPGDFWELEDFKYNFWVFWNFQKHFYTIFWVFVLDQYFNLLYFMYFLLFLCVLCEHICVCVFCVYAHFVCMRVFGICIGFIGIRCGRISLQVKTYSLPTLMLVLWSYIYVCICNHIHIY